MLVMLQNERPKGT